MVLSVSFGRCKRRYRDVLMGRPGYVPLRRLDDVLLRRLGDVPPRRRWVLHLRRTCDLVGTYRETSLRRRYDLFLPGGATTLPLPGYNFVRSDHPKNIKRGDASLYYKDSLSLRLINAPFFFSVFYVK